ncbi:tRNA lysidine(34) synthetase TilS [Metabacillus sp. GX 13764]|nr:tRNA lysidine(34) synthetase TilS [Metabacillus kandeliae]MCD7036661.1 tRNA lysidine(34) synthetase TilS [Metabacillus kandeliae]
MESFYAFIKKHELIEPFSTIAAGVSGGPDSLVLLHLLHSMKDKLGIQVIAVHVDHMFRGKQSENEMKFVETFCREHRIPFMAKQMDAAAYAKEHRLSSQAAARECRYSFFDEAMAETGARYLALAHHGDDQIETILMRLVRGAAGKSSAGIQVKRPFGNGYLIRPFLGTSRKEILDYSEKHGLNPRYDPSNDSDAYTRNRFRKYVLPFIKEENPLAHERFQNFSELQLEDDRLLQELTEREMNRVWIRKEKDALEIDSDELKRLPLPLQRRGIQLILNYLYKDVPVSFSSLHIESLLQLLSQTHPSGSLNFPGGLKVTKSYHRCLFTFEHEEHSPYCLEFTPPGMLNLPNGCYISAFISADPAEIKASNHSFIVSRTDVELPLIVRSRNAGDKMEVKGMNGSKKVKDIFIDAKIPLAERDLWPIVEDGRGSIMWLPGLKKSALEQTRANNGEYIVLHYDEQGIF